jgi:hypothetical protein
MSRRYVISLCDYSGAWSDPWRERCEVIQVDLKLDGDARLWPSRPSASPRLSRHFEDIREYVGRTEAVLAAPVCTVFSGAGAKHPRSDDDVREALALVDACLRIAATVAAPTFALENPVGKLGKWLGDPVYRFQPYEFAGHAITPAAEAYTKRTCLWGWGDWVENLDAHKAPVEPTLGSKMWSDYGGKSERTKEMRSMTPTGFARAFYYAATEETNDE